MKLRHILSTVAITGIILGSAVIVDARPMYHGNENGHMKNSMNLDDKQIKTMNNIYEERNNAVSSLREELRANRIELNALGNNSNADPKRIKELSKNIAELETKMQKINAKYKKKMEKDVGVNMNMGGGGCSFGSRGNRHGGYHSNY